ncbi:hypothetical protein HK28_09335 [Acetobacter sp. DsW_063]|nr:hypothetical protein HK28_09335 [Acetobacter sp. DsW_063]
MPFDVESRYDFDFRESDVGAVREFLLSDLEPIEKRAVFSCVLNNCRDALLREIVQRLLVDASFLGLISELFGNDLAADIGDLASWLRDGRVESQYYDLKALPSEISRTSLPQYRLDTEELLRFSARSCVQPVKKSCVVTTIRNEGIYILDWVAHYRAIGVDKIIIYSNNNTDGSDDLLKALSDAGLIIWCDGDVTQGDSAQRKSYSHCLMLNKEVLNYEWSIFLDMDEFLCFDRNMFSNINDFLDWHSLSREDVVAVNWRFVGSSGQKKRTAGPVYSRFFSWGVADQHVKSIFKTRYFYGSCPHEPVSNSRRNSIMVAANKRPYVPLDRSAGNAKSDLPLASYAQIYHYFFKSAEEFLWKFSRNRGDFPFVSEDIFVNVLDMSIFIDAFISAFNGEGDENGGVMMQRQLPSNIQEYENLLSAEVIRQANDRVQSAYDVRLNKLKDAFRLIVPRFPQLEILAAVLDDGCAD